jgi:hypothetical protein
MAHFTSRVIDPHSVYQAMDRCVYLVQTVVPLVQQPKENTFIFTYRELSEFLANIAECGEFVVGVTQFESYDDYKERYCEEDD